MKKYFIFVALILFLFLAPVQALADGGFFPPPNIDITEPTQKAVIFYSKGCEDLIIQVSYEGDVEDFAWVVPVPSMPEVKASYFEIFFELSNLTISSYYYYRAEGGLTPAEVTVYEQKRVGFYDTAILSSEDPEALINWLKDNGYNFPEEAKDTINHYIQKNWYFVALKVAEEKQQEMYPPPSVPGGVIHPVKFSFKTDKIVYPFKISSINKGETAVLLYVFADHKQEAKDFEMEFADWIEPQNVQYSPYLKPFVKEKIFLTKIRKTFKQDEIKDDIYLTQAADDKPLKPQLNWYIIGAILAFGVLLIILGSFYYIKNFEE